MRREFGMFLGGIGIGSGLAFLLDPTQGRRRRARIRDQAIHMGHVVGDGLDTAVRDLRNRTRGMMAEAKGRMRREHVSDDLLIERARAAMGRVVSHPRAIHMTSRDGCLILRGPILASEVNSLIFTLSRVRGVRGVENHLEVYQEPGTHPSLQGGSTRRMRQGMLQNNWSPATRLLTSLIGGAMAVYTLTRGTAMRGTHRPMDTDMRGTHGPMDTEGRMATGTGTTETMTGSRWGASTPQMSSGIQSGQAGAGFNTLGEMDTQHQWEEDDRTHTSPMGDVLYDRIAA